jgi:2-(1,2-epoxy-1,2-dihydrophenyl)acetyl-CoA isomerase
MSVVEESFRDGVFTLTLNRPEKKNAMSLELLKAVHASLLSARDKDAGVVVIRGAGRTFSSGGDVIEFMESAEPAARVDSMADFLNRSIVQIRRMPAVVVAVVEGLAVGAGLSLSLACDLTIAGKKALMNMGYRRIGLTPDGGGSLFLPRLAGMKRFNELFFLSRNVTMDEAREIGLVNVVVEEEELEEKLAALVDGLKAQPPETTARAKELVNLALWQGLESHLDKERFFVSDFAQKPRFQNRLKELFKKK